MGLNIENAVHLAVNFVSDTIECSYIKGDPKTYCDCFYNDKTNQQKEIQADFDNESFFKFISKKQSLRTDASLYEVNKKGDLAQIKFNKNAKYHIPVKEEDKLSKN